MRRAAIFDDPQASRGDLVFDPVVEKDDAVRDIFLETLARQRAVAALAGDHGSEPAIFQPTEQASQLGAQHSRILQSGEERLDRIEHDALGTDRVDGEAEPNKQPFEVVLAAFLNLAALDADVIDGELTFGDQRIEFVAERGDVADQVLSAFLEAHEDAGFAVLNGAVDEERGREQGFAAAGRAAHQSRAPSRQTTVGDVVEADDASGRLGDAVRCGRPGLQGKPVFAKPGANTPGLRWM